MKLSKPQGIDWLYSVKNSSLTVLLICKTHFNFFLWVLKSFQLHLNYSILTTLFSRLDLVLIPHQFPQLKQIYCFPHFQLIVIFSITFLFWLASIMLYSVSLFISSVILKRETDLCKRAILNKQIFSLNFWFSKTCFCCCSQFNFQVSCRFVLVWLNEVFVILTWLVFLTPACSKTWD